MKVKCIKAVKSLEVGKIYNVEGIDNVSGKTFYTLDGICELYDSVLFEIDYSKLDKENNIKPSHYNAGKYDVIWFCQHHNLSFDIGNIIKYIFRAGKKDKDKEAQDLKKAMEYLQRRIDFIENKGDK